MPEMNTNQSSYSSLFSNLYRNLSSVFSRTTATICLFDCNNCRIITKYGIFKGTCRITSDQDFLFEFDQSLYEQIEEYSGYGLNKEINFKLSSISAFHIYSDSKYLDSIGDTHSITLNKLPGLSTTNDQNKESDPLAPTYLDQIDNSDNVGSNQISNSSNVGSNQISNSSNVGSNQTSNSDKIESNLMSSSLTTMTVSNQINDSNNAKPNQPNNLVNDLDIAPDQISWFLRIQIILPVSRFFTSQNQHRLIHTLNSFAFFSIIQPTSCTFHICFVLTYADLVTLTNLLNTHLDSRKNHQLVNRVTTSTLLLPSLKKTRNAQYIQSKNLFSTDDANTETSSTNFTERTVSSPPPSIVNNISAGNMDKNIDDTDLNSTINTTGSLYSIDSILPDNIFLNGTDILDDDQIFKFSKSMPAKYFENSLDIVYSTKLHGFSLKTLYRNTISFINSIDRQRPFILLIKDSQNNIFGAFFDEPPRISNKYSGSGQSFLFKFFKNSENDDRCRLVKYHWQENGCYIMHCNLEYIEIGTDDGNSAIWLNESMTKGRSQKSIIFASPCLSDQEYFNIVAVELFTFV